MTEQTVGYEPRPQPFSSGDGYEAPGRAMQTLGRGIAALGDAFGSLEAEANREAEKRAEYEYLTAKNEFALQENTRLDESIYNYPQTGGNGERFADEWGSGFGERGGQWAERWKGTKYEHRSRYDVSSLRNHYAPRALNSQQGFVTQHQIGLADRNISGAVSVVTSDPASLDQSIQIAEGAIKSAPGLNIAQQNILRNKAAELAFNTWLIKAEKELTADQIEATKKQWEERAKNYVPTQEPTASVGPMSDLGIRDFTSKPGRGFGRLDKPTHIVLHDVSGDDPGRKRVPEGGNIPQYHITFDKSGINLEVPFDRQAPHARSFNSHSIGISHIGYEGDKLDPQAVKNGAKAVLMVQEKFGIPAENILTHPEGGERATKSGGKDPNEAAWRKDVLAYIGANRQQLLAEMKGGGAAPQVAGEAARAVSQSGLDFIKKEEGWKPQAYADGRQTSVGWGTRGRPGEKIDEAEGERRLQAELAEANGAIDKAIKVPLAQPQRDALVSYVFNAGPNGAARNVFAAINDGDMKKAAELMKADDKAGVVASRRGREVQMFLAGGAPTGEDLKARSLTAGRVPANDTGAPREAGAIPGGVTRVADASGQTVAPAGFSRTTQDYLMRDFEQKQKKLDDVITKKRKAEAADAFVTGVMQGNVSFNPYNTEEKKVVDEFFSERSAFGNQVYGGNIEAINQGVVIAQKIGYAPKSLYQAFQGLANSKDPKKQMMGFTAITNLIDSNPNILDMHDGQNKLVERAQLYASLRGLAYEPSEAMAKMAEMATPEYEKKVEFRKKDAKTFVDGLGVGDFADKAFDPGWMSFEPNIEGGLGGVKDEVLHDFKRLAEGAFLKWGDKDIAKTFAIQKIKALYGKTYVNDPKPQKDDALPTPFTPAGELIKYPPERFFGGPNGTDSATLRRQMVDDVRAQLHRFAGRTDGPTPEAGLPTPVPALDETSVHLVSDDTTQRHIAATGMPSYKLRYINKNGLPEFVLGENGQPKRWIPDLSAQKMKAEQTFLDRRAPAMETEARKAKIEAERPAQRKQQQEELTVPSWRRDNSGQGVNKPRGENKIPQ